MFKYSFFKKNVALRRFSIRKPLVRLPAGSHVLLLAGFYLYKVEFDSLSGEH